MNDKIYIIIAIEKFGPDWDIYDTVFSNKQEAEKICKQLNSGITGYEYTIKEKFFNESYSDQ